MHIKNDNNLNVVTLSIITFLMQWLYSSRAVCSPLETIFAVNIELSLLLGMRLQRTWLKEIARLQCCGYLIRKLYLICQHNS